MAVRNLNSKDILILYQMWQHSIDSGELLYKPMSLELFTSKFFDQHQTTPIMSYVYDSEGVPQGFISGVIDPSKSKAYLTMIFVEPSSRHQGYGTLLLNHLEQEVHEKYPNIVTIDILFFNPMTLEWIIPHTNRHDHPNAPGVDYDSDAYVFFKKHGYIEFAKQNSYYRNIERYTYSHLIEELIQSLKKNKIEISLYDQEKHHGFQELFDDLKNSYWQTEITQAVQDKKPVLVASHDGKIIGFTGPLRVQPSLRGYFAGIGVHQEYRGLGVGKVLFAALCKELSRLGAHYMSLFTGENNQARKIYERENFVIVRSWANMRKDINHA